MGLPLVYPLVNGFRFAWASVEIKLAGTVFFALECNYSRTRNRQIVYVNHPDPVGKTIGKNEYSGDVTLLLAEYNALQTALIVEATKQSLGTGYGNAFFDVIVQYNENGGDVITDTLKNCTLDQVERSMAEGPDAIKVKITLNPLKIIYNNADDLQFPLTAPVGT